LKNSDLVITAWHNDQIIGLGNAISDGHMVVYYPYLCVHPNYQHLGIGKEILHRMKAKYSEFHSQVLVAVPEAVNFYKKSDFELSSANQAMWIYQGNDH
jgi:N-acetylglutamate synthase-like GNAT family acetyltransferase